MQLKAEIKLRKNENLNRALKRINKRLIRKD